MAFLGKILGDPNERFLKKFDIIVNEINALEDDIKKLKDEELKEKTQEFKKRLKNKDNELDDRAKLDSNRDELDNILPEAFAVVREASRRTLNQRHYDVQLLGGIVLHQGKIAEMKTGEGKTLAATLPVYLNALLGRGVHVVTVNDYLSRRDTVWMGQIYHALGLTVACINHDSSFTYDPDYIKEKNEEELDKERDETGSFKVVHDFLRPCSRKEAYGADITYGTNNEFGFDFLRDNMAYQKEQLVQRDYNFAIVDEIDSILIDESRTPLIVSAPDEESGELYKTFSQIVPRLKAEEDYTIDEKQKAVSVTDSGISKVEKMLGIKDIYTEHGIKYVHHLEQALRAHALFKLDKDYVVKKGEIIIVDEFTGRLMPGRRWSEGLHQAIEAKEGVPVQKESRTMASITFQNYFRMYEKLSGMTGTALTSAEEFHKVYDLEVVSVPTNKPLVRKDNSDFIYQNEKGKLKAVVAEIKKRYKKGQPVLVGTVSIEKNEYLSALLKTEDIPHKLLNAKQHEEEGEIIAQAGRHGAVTVATNMAGRGVDIVLGGNPQDPEQSQRVREAGGLFVLGTERHEARRIDNQLRGRSGRQGDPGESRFFVSMEDDLMRIFGSDKIKNMMSTFGIPEDQPIENKMISRAIESAQTKIEGMNFDIRKRLLDFDDVMSKQRIKIYNLRRRVLEGDGGETKKIIKEFFKDREDDYKKLLDKTNEMGEENFLKAQRVILLRIIDMLWVGHLEAMDYMRSSVNLRAYGQRDPLVEYKNEGVRMFRELESAMKEMFLKMSLSAQPEGSQVPQPSPMKKVGLPTMAPRSGAKVGRNDPCPCGSDKKYKKCHGK